MAISLTSRAFHQGAPIPPRYTCDGADTSPPLSWGDVPPGAGAFALVMDDPDAPTGIFTHWVIFNLPADLRGLDEGVPKAAFLENGAAQGQNDFGYIGFGGPCPPPGPPHRYRFRLYALDGPLGIEPAVTKQRLLDEMPGHILDEVELMGTYQR